MAENQTDTAVQEQTPFTIRVEDAGAGTKKVWVEIPRESIDRKIEEQFKELRQEAVLPGFRKGHAPRRLIEKRFSADVKEQVRRTLISESYEQAVTQHSLQVIGEPEFENPDKIRLEDDKPLTYCFSVEIQPDFAIPDLEGIKVRKPRIIITEDHINQAMMNLREQQGTIVPVEDRGVQEKDIVTADIKALCDGNEINNQAGATFIVRPGRIAGIQVDDLPAQVAGAMSGQTRTITLKVPDTYPNESLRGKDVQIEITIKDIKKLEPADIDDQFLSDLGFSSEQELREALREQMVERIEYDIKQAMRRQVIDDLLSRIDIQLPNRLSERQRQRVVSRRAVDLMLRGVPQEQISQNLEHLSTGAAEEAARELKVFFILQKIAEEQNVDVTEGEINGRIAMIALQQGRRPEKLKQEMARDRNMLAQLYVQMREEKAIDAILAKAQIEEVEPTAEQAKAGAVNPSDADEPKTASESSAT